MIYEWTQTNVNILGSSYETSLLVYPQINFLVPRIYINIQSHQHSILQLPWIHMVHGGGGSGLRVP